MTILFVLWYFFKFNILRTRGHGPRSLSEICTVNAVTKETTECSIQNWLWIFWHQRTAQYNFLTKTIGVLTPHKIWQVVLPLLVLLQPGKILHPNPLSERKLYTKQVCRVGITTLDYHFQDVLIYCNID